VKGNKIRNVTRGTAMIKQDEICEAINSKKVISFDYHGRTRLLEPFCFGIHKSTGNKVLRGYQIGGFSESGKALGWKLL